MSESRDPAGDSTTTNNMGEVREAEHQGAAVKAASVHSIADCSNEIVLMVGGRFSKRKTDGDHPFGLYRAKYLASFVVATLLFFVGGFFSTSEAVKKLIAIAGDPTLRDVNRMELLVAFIVVVISASRRPTSVWNARTRRVWACSVSGGTPSPPNWLR